ncbi:MAG: tetratricopeptide repeat protein [Anaerolineales bacterium]
MVWDLQQSAPVFQDNPYKPLNIRREILVESRIRAIFWLTEREAIDLARQAPDFWAFRHRVVDFLDPLERTSLWTLGWAADTHSAMAGRDDLQAKITYRERWLADEGKQDWLLAYNLHLGLSRLYGEQTDFPHAQAHLEAAATLASEMGDAARHGEALIALGGLLEQARQFDAAEAAYRQAGEVNPGSPLPQMRLSGLALARGQFDTALHLARQCADHFSHDDRAWTYLGWLLGRLGNLPEALAACHEALRLNADNTRAWWQIGMLQSMHGEARDAWQSLTRACALDGEESLYWLSLAVEQDAQKQTKSALSCARRAVRVNVQDAEAWLVLGGLLHARRRLKVAVACYVRAFELSGQDNTLAALVCASLSLAWREKRDQPQSAYWRMQALDHLPAAEALGHAACYALDGDVLAAQNAMRQAMSINRWQAYICRNLPVLLHLAELD